MRKHIWLFCIIFFIDCVPIGYLNTKAYQRTNRLVYERMFESKTNITDQATIDEILKILGTAKKTPIKMITKEQLLFIREKDTLSVWKNGNNLQDKNGTYQLTDNEENELTKLLNK